MAQLWGALSSRAKQAQGYLKRLPAYSRHSASAGGGRAGGRELPVGGAEAHDQQGWPRSAGALARPSPQKAGCLRHHPRGRHRCLWGQAAEQPWSVFTDTKMPRWQTLFGDDPVWAGMLGGTHSGSPYPHPGPGQVAIPHNRGRTAQCPVWGVNFAPSKTIRTCCRDSLADDSPHGPACPGSRSCV